MDQDVVIDDVVDTQTFDLTELTENKTIKKTFTFRKVGEKKHVLFIGVEADVDRVLFAYPFFN